MSLVGFRSASASDIPVQQALGRGPRLPYGKRTGDEMVDTLTVIANDRFDAVIAAAKAPGSIVIVIKTLTIGERGASSLARARF